MSGPLFTGANHLCVVTADIDRAVRVWSDRYGLGPWDIWTKDRSNMSAAVDGEPAEYAMRAAMCRVSPTFRIELIQPLDDRSPYARSLEQHRGVDHLHHVRLDVADYEAARSHLAGVGVRVAADEEFAGAPDVTGRFRATYLATQADLGFLLQIGEAPQGFEMPEPDAVYPPS
jgi:Glyoxalase/Bleomycin resistance protein/Dioxygenase superfamily